MAIKYINGYQTALTTTLGAAATTMVVADASRLVLASGEFYRLTIHKNGLFELVDVTAISGNTLTIARGQENTVAADWAVGAEIVCSVTAAQLEKIKDAGGGLELWYTATNNTINAANGTKQKRTLTENSTLVFTLNDGQDITLILNPATFTAMFPAISWFGAAPSLIASKEHTVVISRDGSLLRGWWQVAA